MMDFKSFFNLQQPHARYKWMVFSRIMAAIFIAYWLAALITMAFSLLLTHFGVMITEAVLTASMISFIIYSILVIFIFSCKSLREMWLWLVILMIVFNILVFILQDIST